MVSKTDANECIPSADKTKVYTVYGSNTPDTSERFYITATSNGVKITQLAQMVINGVPSSYSLRNACYTRTGIVVSANNIVWSAWEKLVTESDLNNALSNYKKTKTITETVTTGGDFGEFRINHYINSATEPKTSVITQGATPYFVTVNAHHSINSQYIGTTFILWNIDGTRARSENITIELIVSE